MTSLVRDHALSLLSEPGLNIMERSLDRVGMQQTREEVAKARRKARNARYHREVQILIALLQGEYPILKLDGFQITRFTDGYDVFKPEDCPADQTLAEFIEEVLFQCDGGTITCERPGREGDPSRVTFQILFGNGPGELIADWSYSDEAADNWSDDIGHWHNLLTE